MPKCVLIVDDDRTVIAVAQSALQGKGYEVMTAGDGLEALEVLKKKIPDLILLDVHMPKMDGYTFIMKKNSDLGLTNIPVIVLTAEAKTEPLFKRHKVRAYLLKPINTQDLLDKIQAVIG